MIKATPDELLEQIQQTEAKESRGALTIFFGSAPGVGKTYAMLSAAQVEKDRGVDVIIGIIETHKRHETEVLVEGFERLALKEIAYKGNTLKEFDLEAALARNPRLILVDELAHSNLGDHKYAKRWQDIDELLQAGIDVYTTLNVQHLESLNDVVSQITGIRVWETIPDHVFNQADEVKIIDLPPDELLERLREGKIYMPQQIAMAREHFFKKGNLLALRELALRKIADRVDDQVCDYQKATSSDQVWATKDRLLVYLDLTLDPEGLIRAASRMANGLRAEWVVVAMSKACGGVTRCEEALKKAFQLAEDLGAETHMLLKGDPLELIQKYAELYHATKILLQQPCKNWFSIFGGLKIETLIRTLTPIEICIIGSEKTTPSRIVPKWGSLLDHWTFDKTDLLGVMIPLILSQIFFWSPIEFNPFVIFSLYGACSVAIAVSYGFISGLLALVMSILLSVAFGGDIEKWILSYPLATGSIGSLAFGIIGLLGQLSQRLKLQSKSVLIQSIRAQVLYKMSKELSGALTLEHILAIGMHYMKQIFPGKILLLLQDRKGNLEVESIDPKGIDFNVGVAQWAYDHNQPAGLGTQILPASKALYVPLSAPMQVRGVVVLEPESSESWQVSENFQLLQTFLSPLSLAIERVYYLDMAQDALLNAENERFQGAILNAISDSLRQPLKRLLELSNTLPDNYPATGTLKEETLELERLLHNLEDMTRLQSGQVALELSPEKMPDLIHNALIKSQKSLMGYAIELKLPSALPEIHVDKNLMQRVFWHLLQNITRYTPIKTVIQIEVHEDDEFLIVSIEDNGPGLPQGMEEKVFEKFTRGEAQEQSAVGLGLGLSICRAIIERHAGKIWADSSPGKGVRFTFRIPLSRSQ